MGARLTKNDLAKMPPKFREQYEKIANPQEEEKDSVIEFEKAVTEWVEPTSKEIQAHNLVMDFYNERKGNFTKEEEENVLRRAEEIRNPKENMV